CVTPRSARCLFGCNPGLFGVDCGMRLVKSIPVISTKQLGVLYSLPVFAVHAIRLETGNKQNKLK
ncbi:hypothetical protein, partial [Candidatus Thiosymbion oneisti]|uniref:hypothetical protein n=1 Tax=Candidatus Thiosymbion oneisti TaxID=589554 RepID=UPI001C4049DE